ncbi:hypothetical protein PRIPAC_75144 [Pristionchus pacificus]|uniref:Uncharacterized protein n=1 Tax=Pristionchus pacificus TaxID=54126 RepID=A0A2A6D043_PRIPA|nr:hypothetical protein PRIPAC_75144 [Pristionchus pacificus]|eukprot:PDM83844.1 hypothetical protein PRIPAC_30331 [Pristionchus pacificus]
MSGKYLDSHGKQIRSMIISQLGFLHTNLLRQWKNGREEIPIEGRRASHPEGREERRMRPGIKVINHRCIFKRENNKFTATVPYHSNSRLDSRKRPNGRILPSMNKKKLDGMMLPE